MLNIASVFITHANETTSLTNLTHTSVDKIKVYTNV